MTYDPRQPLPLRLATLAKLTNRPIPRRRLPLPNVELHAWTFAAILRPNFLRVYGKALP